MTDPGLDLGLRLGIVAAAGGAVWLSARGSEVWRSYRRRRALETGRTPELTRDVPALLLFSGTLCVDCARQKEILLGLREELGAGWRLHEVHAASEVQLARRFRVESVPATVVLDRAGRPVAVNYGLVDAGTLSKQLQPLLNPVGLAS